MADGQTSFAFHGDGLGLEPSGEVTVDGVSEPLRFVLDASVRIVRRVGQAGATIIIEPGTQPRGVLGAFADPDGHLWMATSVSAPPEES